jgi:hypothetical protein
VPADDLYPRIKAAAVARIVGLDLQSDDPSWGIGESVYSFRGPTLDNVDLPCVQLTSEGEREERLAGTTEHVDYLWPVRVFLMDRDPGGDPGRGRWSQSWRKRILDAFADEALPDVAEVVTCLVEPTVLYDVTALAYQLVVGSLLLKFWTRQAR